MCSLSSARRSRRSAHPDPITAPKNTRSEFTNVANDFARWLSFPSTVRRGYAFYATRQRESQEFNVHFYRLLTTREPHRRHQRGCNRVRAYTGYVQFVHHRLGCNTPTLLIRTRIAPYSSASITL